MSAAGRTFVDIIVYYTNILWFSDIILNNRSLVSTRRGHAIYFPCFFRLFFLLCTLDEHFRTVHFCHFLLLLTKSALIFARQGFFCPPFLSIPHKPPTMYIPHPFPLVQFSRPAFPFPPSLRGGEADAAIPRCDPSHPQQQNKPLRKKKGGLKTLPYRMSIRPPDQFQRNYPCAIYYIIYNVCARYTAALPWGLPVTGLDLHFRPLHCTNLIDGLYPGYSLAMRR